MSYLLKDTFYPSADLSASSKMTSSIISELETRANQLEENSSSTLVYCLSAFANARGFLTA